MQVVRRLKQGEGVGMRWGGYIQEDQGSRGWVYGSINRLRHRSNTISCGWDTGDGLDRALAASTILWV